MSCIKEERFLFWKFKSVIHKYEIHYISKFMDCSDDFEVKYKCVNCGATKKEHFVEQDDLILMGIPVEELNKVNKFKWYYPNNKS